MASGGNPGEQINAIPGSSKPGKGLGSGSSGGNNGGGGNTNTNNPGGGTTGFPKGGGGLTGGHSGGGGGLTGGGPNPGTLPVNPAVPNDHRDTADFWPRGRWVNNTFATVINGHNNGATRENAEINHPAFHGRSVWWYIEWPDNAQAIKLRELEATTKGSTFDTTMGVLYVPKDQRASQWPLNNDYFKWNNNAPGETGPFSTVVIPEFTLNPGDRVYFMVDGVGRSSGKIRLRVKMKK